MRDLLSSVKAQSCSLIGVGQAHSHLLLREFKPGPVPRAQLQGAKGGTGAWACRTTSEPVPQPRAPRKCPAISKKASLSRFPLLYRVRSTPHPFLAFEAPVIRLCVTRQCASMCDSAPWDHLSPALKGAWQGLQPPTAVPPSASSSCPSPSSQSCPPPS